MVGTVCGAQRAAACRSKARSGPGGAPSGRGERRKVPTGISADVARVVWHVVDQVGSLFVQVSFMHTM